MPGDPDYPRLPDGSRPNLSVRVEPPRSLQRNRRYTDRVPDADLSGIASMLRRRRGTILLMFLVVFGSVVAFTLLLPKTYESSALILVEQQPRMESPALATLERLGRGSVIETEIELVTSRRVIERAVDQLDLHVSVAPSAGELNLLQTGWPSSAPVSANGRNRCSRCSTRNRTLPRHRITWPPATAAATPPLNSQPTAWWRPWRRTSRLVA